MSCFFTITNPQTGLYKEKGSKFLSTAIHVSSEEEVKIHLEDLRKKYYDARHHCYAWVIGMTDQKWRANDDGEPSHSAGDPILGQIRSFELTNVLVVVVRYFGGTKLGVGGLINAYRNATEQALMKAEKKEIYEEVNVQLNFPYDLLNTVERMISDLEINIVNRDFQQDCRIKGSLRKDYIESLKLRIKDLFKLQLSIEDSNLK